MNEEMAKRFSIAIKGNDITCTLSASIFNNRVTIELHIVNNSVLFTSYLYIFLLVVVFVYSHSYIPV